MKQRKININVIKRIAIVLAILLVAIFILVKAENFIKVKEIDGINLVINSRNVTERLKHEIKIQDGVIYVSLDDIENFFDKYIYTEEETNEVITTYNNKIASIGFDANKMTLNGSIRKTNASAIKDGETVYLPISEMLEVYNVELTNIEESKTITLDSLDRKQVKANVKSNVTVKNNNEVFSKTVEKIKKGSTVIVIDSESISEGKKWVKVRTENGKIGYIKTNKLENIKTIREEEIEQKQITGKVNMFWDYFSEYVKAPDRTGQTVEGVNVVSPAFFYLDKNDGTLKENIGTAGIAYINWAHSNGYKVWPMISNADAGIKITSNILNSYTKRQELIQSIVEKCALYDIDGINIDFENMYKADKDKFSRFIIELMPRMQEMGIVLSVDVTAPDGGENWSECYDRNVIGDVADYLVFMAYDQHGNSGSKVGTTAGLNWVETSLKKIIEYDEVDTEKIILGLPFYTRQWIIASDGTIKDRGVVSMMNIKIPNNVEKQWDDTLKQNYIEYKSGKNTIKMWIEDGRSIKEKVSLVTKYNLGGTSAWRKDMETSNIWTIIREELQK
ncbi:MAG: hypothetical protein IJE68_06455 [Clostridia bacterium]|nr:hypothetical protein [Clostridia bacterium]